MSTIPRQQIIMSAIQQVNSLPRSESGLYIMPPFEKPISRAAAMNVTIRDLVNELSERSSSSLLIEKLTGPDTKHFSGVLLNVQKEASSTRAVLTLETGTDRESKDSISKEVLPAGQEQVRSERTDSSDAGRALAMQAKSLVGHRVLVTVHLEAMSNGKGKVRVLQDIRDLGKAA